MARERDYHGRYRQVKQAAVERFLDLIASGWGVYAAAREVGMSGGKSRNTVRRSGLIAAYEAALLSQRRAFQHGADPRLVCPCGARKLIGHVGCPTCTGRMNREKPQKPRRSNRSLGYAIKQRDCCGPPPHRRCEPRDCDDPEQEYADYCGSLIGPKHIAQTQDATGRCEACVAVSRRLAQKSASSCCSI